MNQKEYELIAGVIAKNHRFNLIEDEQLGSDVASITRLLMQEFANMLEQNYPTTFDRDKFLAACGITQ